MEKPGHPRIKTLFILATLILLALSIFSYVRINMLIRTAELLTHTQRVKLALEKTFAELLQAETAQRGYLHAKDSSFLKELAASRKKLDKYISEIDSLTKGNPAQQINVRQLKDAVATRLSYLDMVLTDANAGPLPPSRWLAGKALMATARAEATEMATEQDHILQNEQLRLNKETYVTPLFTIILIVCAVLFLVIAYLRILTELKLSDNLKIKLENKRLELESANAELLKKNDEALATLARVKRSEQTLQAQTVQLEENNKALLRLNKELELFNYISSHDLQEPLRKIQIFASRIQSNELANLSERGKDDLHRMQEAAYRMQALIEDLLAYSRTTNSDSTLENCDLAAIVNEVKAGFAEEMQQKNATVDVKEMCHAKILRFQFRQMMQNLISNSLKFSRPGQPVIVLIQSTIIAAEALQRSKPALFKSVLPTDGTGANDVRYCHISVCDNGIGFEPQYKERIFEIFQRLHDKSSYLGTGIGLAIVKKIVENHNGFIEATSRPDEGACFDIYLPTQS